MAANFGISKSTVGLFHQLRTLYFSNMNIPKCWIMLENIWKKSENVEKFRKMSENVRNLSEATRNVEVKCGGPKKILVYQSYQIICRLALVKNTQRFLKFVNSQHFSVFLDRSSFVEKCRSH